MYVGQGAVQICLIEILIQQMPTENNLDSASFHTIVAQYALRPADASVNVKAHFKWARFKLMQECKHLVQEQFKLSFLHLCCQRRSISTCRATAAKLHVQELRPPLYKMILEWAAEELSSTHKIAILARDLTESWIHTSFCVLETLAFCANAKLVTIMRTLGEMHATDTVPIMELNKQCGFLLTPYIMQMQLNNKTDNFAHCLSQIYEMVKDNIKSTQIDCFVFMVVRKPSLSKSVQCSVQLNQMTYEELQQVRYTNMDVSLHEYERLQQHVFEKEDRFTYFRSFRKVRIPGLWELAAACAHAARIPSVNFEHIAASPLRTIVIGDVASRALFAQPAECISPHKHDPPLVMNACLCESAAMSNIRFPSPETAATAFKTASPSSKVQRLGSPSTTSALPKLKQGIQKSRLGRTSYGPIPTRRKI